MTYVILQADGATRPTNPGPSAYGFVIISQGGQLIEAHHDRLGPEPRTNNEAEYHGLIYGLIHCSRHYVGADVKAQMDSALVVNQVNGNWRINHDHLRQLHARVIAAVSLVQSYGGRVSIEWIPRELNTLADAEAAKAFNQHNEMIGDQS